MRHGRIDGCYKMFGALMSHLGSFAHFCGMEFFFQGSFAIAVDTPWWFQYRLSRYFSCFSDGAIGVGTISRRTVRSAISKKLVPDLPWNAGRPRVDLMCEAMSLRMLSILLSVYAHSCAFCMYFSIWKGFDCCIWGVQVDTHVTNVNFAQLGIWSNIKKNVLNPFVLNRCLPPVCKKRVGEILYIIWLDGVFSSVYLRYLYQHLSNMFSHMQVDLILNKEFPHILHHLGSVKPTWFLLRDKFSTSACLSRLD